MLLAVAASAASAAPYSGRSPAAKPFRFAVLCDSRASHASDPGGTASPYYDAGGVSPYFQNVALARCREPSPDFVVHPGDLARGKKPSLTGAAFAAALDRWNDAMTPVYQAGIPVFYIRGRHS